MGGGRGICCCLGGKFEDCKWPANKSARRRRGASRAHFAPPLPSKRHGIEAAAAPPADGEEGPLANMELLQGGGCFVVDGSGGGLLHMAGERLMPRVASSRRLEAERIRAGRRAEARRAICSSLLPSCCCLTLAAHLGRPGGGSGRRLRLDKDVPRHGNRRVLGMLQADQDGGPEDDHHGHDRDNGSANELLPAARHAEADSDCGRSCWGPEAARTNKRANLAPSSDARTCRRSRGAEEAAGRPSGSH